MMTLSHVVAADVSRLMNTISETHHAGVKKPPTIGCRNHYLKRGKTAVPAVLQRGNICLFTNLFDIHFHFKLSHKSQTQQQYSRIKQPKQQSTSDKKHQPQEEFAKHEFQQVESSPRQEQAQQPAHQQETATGPRATPVIKRF